ncbi:LysR family transcriptional regulator [Streptomyces sp. NPDC059224]|uniref:helix-turn-helix domain-containing protein n=1 Tax=Streptomyces sp. NPDC059224 TaxID=3346775 RepID=UPI0036B2BFC6
MAVAKELNFSAAARRLHMATSPLSRRIRDLEREFDPHPRARRCCDPDRAQHHVRRYPARGAPRTQVARRARRRGV